LKSPKLFLVDHFLAGAVPVLAVFGILRVTNSGYFSPESLSLNTPASFAFLGLRDFPGDLVLITWVYVLPSLSLFYNESSISSSIFSIGYFFVDFFFLSPFIS